MTTTRPHTNRDDVSELDRLREEYEIRHDIEVADALIAALGDEIAELTGQNIDLEVWRASAEERADRAEADLAAMTEDRDSWQAQCMENSKMLKEWERKKYAVSMTLDETRRDLAAAREEARMWEWVAREVVLSGYSRADIMQGLHEHDIDDALARYQPAEEDV